MSFNADMLRSRLASSTEAADSITSTAHWILFHKRHSKEIAEQWAEAVVSDDNKLPEIYIANEVIQQSKIKRKNEFVDAFSKVLPDALAKAYAQSDLPTRDRITRVVRVWKDRAVFTPQAQRTIEETIKSAGESFGSSVPAELVVLVKHFKDLKDARQSSSGVTEQMVETVKKELDTIRSLVEEYAKESTSIVAPSIEPLPSQKPAVEVYTAEAAQKSLESGNTVQNGDDDMVGYASDSEEQAGQSAEVPPEKKPRVEVDPKLTSFLASISNKD